MQFMTLIKPAGDFGPPPAALMDAMTKAREAATTDAKVVATGRLAAIAAATRVRISNGKVTVTDGPFTESKEVVASYAVLEVKSKEEAIEAARWLMEQFVEFWPGWQGETEVRQILSPADHPQA